MSSIDVFSRRRTENLHNVITCAEQHRAENVDQKMERRAPPGYSRCWTGNKVGYAILESAIELARNDNNDDVAAQNEQ
jgi:hypothetical protein